jgi:hypothetical protein
MDTKINIFHGTPTLEHISSSANSLQIRRDGGLVPTMVEVAAVFHLPIDRAAKKLSVGQTWLKHMCREHGVARWPYRKIQSLIVSAKRLEESIADIDPTTCTDLAQLNRYDTVLKQIRQLHDARAAICRGQSPEESTISAQDAIKAAARRTRASAVNRGKTVGELPCNVRTCCHVHKAFEGKGLCKLEC